MSHHFHDKHNQKVATRIFMGVAAATFAVRSLLVS